MGRTVIVGDVHGCARELEELLAYVGLSAGDRLVTVGDMVVRGPSPRKVLGLLRELGARAVRGNHEDRLLRWQRSRGTSHELRIGSLTRKTAESLKPADWEFLESLPLWVDLPEHNVRVVHAGMVPGLPIEDQEPRTLMNVRALSRDKEPLEERGVRSWAQHYQGPEHVVFGHNAMPKPEIAPFATGIDTGAVYGGRLTAMVLRENESVPPASRRHEVLVSVPSHKAYYEKPKV